jgi:hypothetical protein
MAGDRVSDSPRARHEIPNQGSHVARPADVDQRTTTIAVHPTHPGSSPANYLRSIQAVSEWIRLNEAALADYWDGRIYTDEIAQRLQRLP